MTVRRGPDRKAASWSCQCGCTGTPHEAQRAWPSTVYAGRGASRPNSDEVTGSTCAGSRPARAKAARASSYQLACPVEVPW